MIRNYEKKSIKQFFLLGLFIAAPLFAAADFVPSKWQHQRPVTIPSFNEVGYVRLKLDRAVAVGNNGYKDIRVLSGGREVPYQFSVGTSVASEEYIPSKIIDKVVDNAGRLQFVFDLGQNGTLHSKLFIQTGSASPNYQRQVSVYASSSLLPHNSPGWNLLTDKGYIFNFTDRKTVFSTGSSEVSYPQNSSRYLRVVVENGPEGPISLAFGEVYQYVVSPAQEETETLPADVLQKKEEQVTEVITDLGSSGIPSHGLTLSISDKGNFNRTAYLFGSNDATAWSRIGQGQLSQIDTPRFTGGNVTISYPEATYRYYKVSIQNFDDVALTVAPHVEVAHIIRTVVFEATPNASYTLYYGNPTAYGPRYDLARYFEYFETASLLEVTLGSEHENPEYVAAAGPVVPFTERNKILLNVTLAFLCLLIAGFVGWYIWRHVNVHKSSETSAPISPTVPPTQSASSSSETPLPPNSHM